MRISDWSSDVCSSDLKERDSRGDAEARRRGESGPTGPFISSSFDDSATAAEERPLRGNRHLSAPPREPESLRPLRSLRESNFPIGAGANGVTLGSQPKFNWGTARVSIHRNSASLGDVYIGMGDGCCHQLAPVRRCAGISDMIICRLVSSKV